MAHVRQQIREAVAAAISGAEHAQEPHAQAALPVISVESRQEQVAEDATTIGSSLVLGRLLTLAIVVHVQAASAVDDALDDQAVTIEEALAADRTLGALAVDSSLKSTELEISSESDQLVGRMTLTYEIFYRTSATDVETAA